MISRLHLLRPPASVMDDIDIDFEFPTVREASVSQHPAGVPAPPRTPAHLSPVTNPTPSESCEDFA